MTPPPPDPAPDGGAQVAPPRSGHEGRIARNAGVLAVLTLISRVAGLVRDQSITHYFGASGFTDAFYMAFTIPNVLRRLVAEGTLTAVTQPAYQAVRAREGDAAARRFFASVLGFVLLGLTVLVAAGLLGAPLLVDAFASGFHAEPGKWELTVEITRWLFPVVFAMGLVGLSMAALNAHDEYAVPALAPIVMNVAMIGFTALGALTFERPIFGVVVGVMVGGVVQVLVQLPALHRRGLLMMPRFAFSDPAVKRLMLGFLPGVFTLAVYQLNMVVLRRLASYLAEGSVSYYNTADRLLELTNGVFAIAIAQGAFTSMNELAAKGDVEGLKQLWRFSFKLQNLIAIPAAVGLALLAKPIVSVLFLHGHYTWMNVEQTALCVLFAAPGLVATATIRGSAQVFYALEDRRTPMVVSMGIVVSNLLMGLLSMRLGLGIAGLSGTLAFSNVLQATLLVLLLRRKVGALQMGSVFAAALAKLGVSAVACAAAWGVTQLGAWAEGPSLRNVVVLAAAMAAAVVLYAAGAMLLRFEGADVVADKLIRRLRRLRR